MERAAGARPASEKKTVTVIGCTDYDIDRIREGLKMALEPLGGMRAFVRRGQRVLLKPNLLSAKDPSRAITTHPSIVEAVIEEVRGVGAEPVIGDSPGGIIRGIKRVWENTGMEELAGRVGVELINFEASGSKRVESGPYTYYIARPVLETDVIINLAKLKTHSLTLFTCAVKNMFGVIPGFRKGELHKLFPKPGEFSDMLVHLYGLVKPSLNIVDGILAMEGNGPSAGEPYELGLLIAGDDGVAVDAVAGDIIGYPENFIYTTRIGMEMGLGEGRLWNIDIQGDGKGVRAEGFRLPSNRGLRLIPRPLARLVAPMVWVKPVIDPSRCTGCAVCFENCPVETINKDGGVYRINDRDCIKCLCCHELCPDSCIDIKLSWLAKRFA